MFNETCVFVISKYPLPGGNVKFTNHFVSPQGFFVPLNTHCRYFFLFVLFLTTMDLDEVTKAMFDTVQKELRLIKRGELEDRVKILTGGGQYHIKTDTKQFFQRVKKGRYANNNVGLI